ncbi:hypothetical protein [Bacillus cytotoxicus]
MKREFARFFCYAFEGSAILRSCNITVTKLYLNWKPIDVTM